MSDTVQSIKSQLTRVTRVAFKKTTLLVAALVLGGYELAKHPPIGNIDRGEVGVRLNRFSGSTTQSGEGAMLVIPGLHELRLYSLQDQMYHPERSSKADEVAQHRRGDLAQDEGQRFLEQTVGAFAAWQAAEA